MTRLKNPADTRKNTPSFVSVDTRGIRHELRPKLGQITTRRSARFCGRPISTVNGVQLRRHGGSAGFGGLQACGAGWICPVCAAKIGQHRASEIAKVVERQVNASGSVAMVTLTMRHNRRQSLQSLWNGLAKAWKAATNGRQWRTLRVSQGIDGFTRSVEVTHGDHGWHVHIHALLMFSGDVSKDALDAVGDSMFSRWSKKLVDNGFSAPIAKSGGLDVRRVGDDDGEYLATYLTKIASGIGLEIGRGDLKVGRSNSAHPKDNRSPWQILKGAVEHGGRDAELWEEFERASEGRRAISWSRGLRDLAELGRELTDEEIVEETAEGEVVAVIPADSWMRIRGTRPDLFGELLRLIDAGHDWQVIRAHVQYRDPRLEVLPPSLAVEAPRMKGWSARWLDVKRMS